MSTLCERWKSISYNFENYDYDNKEELSNLFDDVSQYFIIPVLGAIEWRSEYIENRLSKIEDIYKKYHYGEKISYTDEDEISKNLEGMINSFGEIQGLDLYKEINHKAQIAINAVKKEIQEQANEVFGKSTIQNLDFEFNNQYEASKSALESKEKSFIKWLKICFWFTVIIAGLNGAIVYYGIENDRLDFILMRVFILFPILWFLFFISSQIKEDRRVVQSYLHKKVVARSYLNYADSIQKRTSMNFEFQKLINEKFTEEKRFIIDLDKYSDIDKANIFREVFEQKLHYLEGGDEIELVEKYNSLIGSDWKKIIRHRNYFPRLVELIANNFKEGVESNSDSPIKMGTGKAAESSEQTESKEDPDDVFDIPPWMRNNKR